MLTLDDEHTIAALGESLDFWTWDRQPLDKFMKLASVQENNPSQIIEVVRTLILDEEGKEVIQGDVMLPTSILIRIITKITETLGK